MQQRLKANKAALAGQGHPSFVSVEREPAQVYLPFVL